MEFTFSGSVDEFRSLFPDSANSVGAQLLDVSRALSIIDANQGIIMANEQVILDKLTQATAQVDALDGKITKIGVESTATVAAHEQCKLDLAALLAAAGGTSVAVDNALQTLTDSIARASASASRVDLIVADPVVLPVVVPVDPPVA